MENSNLPIIEIHNIQKCFKIFDHPMDRIKEAFSLQRKKYSTEYWALKDISFSVQKGEFIGIVGRNGAGKSTLLKILSNEITPTSGGMAVRGRVSLLQLGVGFDRELSGYENAIFASKLMGYSGSKIDEILKKVIEFADIGEFIHHPVKTYSSGMYSRLSFAVGINVDPDILIADEVLAVGDARFSQKCLRVMHDFKKSGKTVILVTHDTNSVGVFCDRAIWIKDGIVFQDGDARSVAADYANWMLYDQLPDQNKVATKTIQSSMLDDRKDGNESSLSSSELNKYRDFPWLDCTKIDSIKYPGLTVTHAVLLGQNSTQLTSSFKSKQRVRLFLKCVFDKDDSDPYFGWVLNDKNGIVAMHSNNEIAGSKIQESFKKGDTVIAEFDFELPPLNTGTYVFSFGIGCRQEITHRIQDALAIEIVREDSKSKQCGYIIVENESFNFHTT